MRALLLILALAACSRQPVGSLSSSLQCDWDNDTQNYQTHVIYRDQAGEVVGQSPAAGDCNPRDRSQMPLSQP